MTDNLDTKTHNQLKVLCDELNLPKNGSSATLKERIREELEAAEEVTTKQESELPAEPKETPLPKSIKPIEDNKKELTLVIDKDELTKQALEIDPEIQAHIRRGELLKKKDDLIPRIQNIFAGAASVEFVDGDGTAQGLHFKGGPKQQQYVTLHQPENLILRYANDYIARTHQSQLGKLGE